MKLSDCVCECVGGGITLVGSGCGVLLWSVAPLSRLHRSPIRLQPSAAAGMINHTTNRAKNPSAGKRWPFMRRNGKCLLVFASVDTWRLHISSLLKKDWRIRWHTWQRIHCSGHGDSADACKLEVACVRVCRNWRPAALTNTLCKLLFSSIFYQDTEWLIALWAAGFWMFLLNLSETNPSGLRIKPRNVTLTSSHRNSSYLFI